MDPGVPNPFHLSLPDAMTMTVGMEFITMPAINLSKPSEQQIPWSLFGGITVWFLHLNILDALISVACKWGGPTFPVGGLSRLQILEAVISLITILLLLFLIYLPWRMWQSFQSEGSIHNPQMLENTEKKRQALIAFIAMLLNSFFAVYVLATFVATFSLKACGQA
jgi:hypothetical protein